jgi:mono/diheme cytochrome c family protein
MKSTYIISAFLSILSFAAISAAPSWDLARGEKLYVDNCSKCHRKDGKGIKMVYPPLKDSDYIKNGTSHELLRGMIYGRSGRITVNGTTYNGVMTTEIDKNVTDNDAALILTYVYNQLNGINKFVTAR